MNRGKRIGSAGSALIALLPIALLIASCSDMLTDLRPITQDIRYGERALEGVTTDDWGLSPWDSDVAALTSDFFVPPDTDGITITWTTPDGSPVIVDGEIVRIANRPDAAMPTKLIATITYGQATVSKEFDLTVNPPPADDASAVSAAATLLSEDLLGLAEGDTVAEVTRSLHLPLVGPNGESILWSSSAPAILGADGTVSRPTGENATAAQVTLTATIRRGDATETKTFTLSIQPAPAADADAVAADADGLLPRLGTSQDINHVTGDLVLPTIGGSGSTIAWSANPAGIVAADGTVTRPEANTTVTLIATVLRGTESTTVEIPIRVLGAPAAPKAAVLADQRGAVPDFAEGDSLGNVTRTLSLPTLGAAGSTISWASSDPAVDVGTGAVTRHATEAKTVTLTATITNGAETETRTIVVTVPALPQSDADCIVEDLRAVAPIVTGPGDTLSSVTGNLTLPTIGESGSIISWASSNPDVIATDGTVTPAQGVDTPVVLTATITKGFEETTHQYTVLVPGSTLSDEQAVARTVEELAIGYPSGQTSTALTGNLTLPAEGPAGTSISWASSSEDVILPDGTVRRPPATDDSDADVTLTATIQRGSATPATDEFTVTVVRRAATAAERVADDHEVVDVGLAPADSAEFVSGNVRLPTAGPSGTTIEWTSTDPSVLAADGTVTRPTTSDRPVTLTARIASGTSTISKFFNLLVSKRPTSPEVCVGSDTATLDIDFATGDAPYSITGDIELPTAGPSGSRISWASDAPTTVGADGSVTRGATDRTVTLTATIAKDGITSTRTFRLVVKATEADAQERIVADTEQLSLGFAPGDAAGSVGGNIILPTTAPAGSHVSWDSSDITVIARDGRVTRPATGEGSTSVTLTATVRNPTDTTGDTTPETETFTVTVDEAPATAAECVAEDAESLNLDFAPGDTADRVTGDIDLPTVGPAGSGIRWTADPANVVSTAAATLGQVTRPTSDTTVDLTARVEKGDASRIAAITVTVAGAPVADADKVAQDAAVISPHFGVGDAAGAVSTTVELPSTGPAGSTISWSAEPTGVMDTTDGTLTRPAAGSGDTLVVLTATVTSGSESATVTYPVAVKEQPSAGPEAVAETIATLDIQLTDGDSLQAVTDDINLPTGGSAGSTITWESSLPTEVMDFGLPDGGYRPAILIAAPEFFADPPTLTLGEDAVGTFTGTVTSGGTTETTTIPVRVKRRPPTTEEATQQDAKESSVVERITFADGDGQDNVTEGFTLPGTGANGTTYNWEPVPEGGVDIFVYDPGVGTDPDPGEPVPVRVKSRPTTDTDTTFTGTVTRGDSSRPTTVRVKSRAAGATGGVVVTIAVTYPTLNSDPVFGLPTDAIILDRTAAETATVNAATGFAAYKWIVDGVVRATSGTAYTLSAGSYPVGEHRLQLWVQFGGVWYTSPDVVFSVVQN